MLLDERIDGARLLPSTAPIVTLADLLAFVYAYPLAGCMRLCPGPAHWAIKALAPVYRLLQSRERNRAAESISQGLGVCLNEARKLARHRMNHQIRRGCYRLSMLQRAVPAIRDPHSTFGLEHLDRAIAQRRGVLLVSLHLYAIVQANRLLRQKGYRILYLRRLSAPQGLGRACRRWVVPRLLKVSERVFADSDAISADDLSCSLLIAQRLREGGIVHVSADAKLSNTSKTHPFLNSRRLLSSGVLDLARLCRCPVIPFLACYTEAGIRIELGPPLDLRHEGTAQECARANLPILISELERHVRAYPDQWEYWGNS